MASIQGIYLAFFGRPADPLGLEYWEEQTNDGADLSVMLNALSGTEEYQDRFVGMSNEEVIGSIYQALFGREADADGLAHFLEALENGTQTLGSIAVNILDGAQGSDRLTIENKIAAGDIFTASLDTPEEIAAYSGIEAADFGRLFLSTVTEDPATVPTAEAVQDHIDAGLPNYDPGEGQTPPGDGDGDDDGGGDGDGGGAEYDVSDLVVGDLDALAQNDGKMLKGAGNTATEFSIVQIDIDQNGVADFEIALGGQPRLGGHPSFPLGVFDNENGTLSIPLEDAEGEIVPVVKWSVASLDEKSLSNLLADFDVKLYFDKNPDVGTNISENPDDFTEFSAIADTTGSPAGGLDWLLLGGTIVGDDGGNANVSQNIQPLSWLISDAGDGSLEDWNPAPVAAGEYTVSLAVYEKGSADIIGVTTAVFDIYSAPA